MFKLGGNGKPFNFGALQHFPGGGARMETKAGGEKETRGGGGRVQVQKFWFQKSPPHDCNTSWELKGSTRKREEATRRRDSTGRGQGRCFWHQNPKGKSVFLGFWEVPVELSCWFFGTSQIQWIPSSHEDVKTWALGYMCISLYHCISRVRPSTSFFVFPCMVYIHSCGGRARAPRPKTTTRGGGGRIGVESLRMVKFRWNHRIEKSLVLCWFKAFLSSCETPCFWWCQEEKKRSEQERIEMVKKRVCGPKCFGEGPRKKINRSRYTYWQETLFGGVLKWQSWILNPQYVDPGINMESWYLHFFWFQ